MNGNTHTPHPCHYCWTVLYSKGALTRHLNQYHWEELEKGEKLLEEISKQRQEKRTVDEQN